MPRNCLIDTGLHICKFFGKKVKIFFSSPTFALRYLVIAWLSGGTNNLHFATHFSAQKVANVKNYLYFCTRFRLRHSALQMKLCVIKAQRGLGFSPPQTLRWFVSGTPGIARRSSISNNFRQLRMMGIFRSTINNHYLQLFLYKSKMRRYAA